MLPVANWCRITQRSTVGNAHKSPCSWVFQCRRGQKKHTPLTTWDDPPKIWPKFMGVSSGNLEILLVLYPFIEFNWEGPIYSKTMFFSHQVDRFPVSFPLNQSNDMWVQPRLDQNSKPERTHVFLICNIKTSFWGLPLFWTHTQICPRH